jgi:hypothetical protein
MRLITNLARAALVASLAALSACGGTANPTQSGAAAASTSSASSVAQAAGATATSPNGTAIPSAAQIIDSGGNVWTVVGGVVYENGAVAGYSANVTELAYDGSVVYQENAAGVWCSWNGSSWVASDAPGTASLSWTAPTENTDGTPLTDLAGYTIFYGVSPSALTQTIEVTDPSATSYVVSNLNSGTYYFTVAANASDGTESAQSPVGSLAIP